MIEYLIIALVLMFVLVFGFFANHVREKGRSGGGGRRDRSSVPLVICVFSFLLTFFFAPSVFVGMGVLASIFFGVIFVMLMAPVEYFIVRRFFDRWLLFYKLDEIFFPYVSAGVVMGWLVGRVFVSN